MKQVIITVDTEGHRGRDPVEKLIWGKAIDGNEYGINHIMDICDRFGVRALFFVDIAEAWDYGKDKIAEVIKHIVKCGHDVGVHIHPDHMADKNRLFLWEYSKEEQYDIIKKCTDLFTEITGKMPVAFRAGKYGANRDTLDIINELGYKFDFSQFYGQKWCGIDPPIAYFLPQRYKRIIEIPVTIFKSIQIAKFKRYDKIDAVMAHSEYKHIMNEIVKNKDELTVTLFFHSFSMLNWRKSPDNPTHDGITELKFIKALEYVNESRHYEFTSLKSLIERYNQFHLNENDTIENIIKTRGLLRSIWFLLKKSYSIRKSNNKARLVILSVFLFSILIFFTLLYLILY